MSGALNSVFGGGNVLGLMMNIASVAFPPMAIANSIGNLLTQAIGSAVKQAVNTLVQEFGMPKFLGSAVNQMVESVVDRQMKSTLPAADAAVSQHQGVQDWMSNFTAQLTDRIIESARKTIDSKAESGSGSAKGKIVAQSWLQAIALAMGEIMGDKAAQLVSLSEQMTKLNADGKGITEQINSASNDKSMAKLNSKQQDNARDFSAVQAQFQAVSQEMSILSNTFANAIKSIGEGLTAMGRKG